MSLIIHAIRLFILSLTSVIMLVVEPSLYGVEKCSVICFQLRLCPGLHWGSSDYYYRPHRLVEMREVGEVSLGPATFRGSTVAEKIKQIVRPFH